MLYLYSTINDYKLKETGKLDVLKTLLQKLKKAKFYSKCKTTQNTHNISSQLACPINVLALKILQNSPKVIFQNQVWQMAS